YHSTGTGNDVTLTRLRNLSLGQQLFAWMALGVVCFALAIYAHSRCEILVPNQASEKAQSEHRAADDSWNPVRWIWIAVEEIQAEQHQKQFSQKPPRPSWFCSETKITDLLLALFAYALAAVSWIGIQSSEKS